MNKPENMLSVHALQIAAIVTACGFCQMKNIVVYDDDDYWISHDRLIKELREETDLVRYFYYSAEKESVVLRCWSIVENVVDTYTADWKYFDRYSPGTELNYHYHIYHSQKDIMRNSTVSVDFKQTVHYGRLTGGWLQSNQHLLRIDNLKPSDDARLYTCELKQFYDELNVNLTKQFMRLFVRDLEANITFKISRSNINLPQEGDVIELTCNSQIRNISFKMGFDILRNCDPASSVCRFKQTLHRSNNHVPFLCTATTREERIHPALDSPYYRYHIFNANSIWLEVKFKPNRLDMTVKFREDFVQVGTVVSVECETDSALPPAQITWMKGNEALTCLSSCNVEKNQRIGDYGGFISTSVLSFTAREDDVGLYACTVESAHGKTLRQESTLKLYILPSTIQMSEWLPSASVNIGTRVSAQCEVDSALPNTRVTWRRDNEPLSCLSPSESCIIAQFQNEAEYTTTSKLTILFTEDYIASYSCWAQGKNGPLNAWATLEKAVVPQELIMIKRFPQNDISIGKSVYAECKATPANKETEITWRRNNEKVSCKDESLHCKFRNIFDGKGRSMISRININVRPGDSGQYSCSVKGDEGVLLKRSALRVIVPAKTLELIVPFPTGLIGLYTTVVMLCSADNPQSHIWWTKNQKQLNCDWTINSCVINASTTPSTKTSSLSFTTRATDSGVYACKTHGHKKEIHSRESTLIIGTELLGTVDCFFVDNFVLRCALCVQDAAQDSTGLAYLFIPKKLNASLLHSLGNTTQRTRSASEKCALKSLPYLGEVYIDLTNDSGVNLPSGTFRLPEYVKSMTSNQPQDEGPDYVMIGLIIGAVFVALTAFGFLFLWWRRTKSGMNLRSKWPPPRAPLSMPPAVYSVPEDQEMYYDERLYSPDYNQQRAPHLYGDPGYSAYYSQERESMSTPERSSKRSSVKTNSSRKRTLEKFIKPSREKSRKPEKSSSKGNQKSKDKDKDKGKQSKKTSGKSSSKSSSKKY